MNLRTAIASMRAGVGAPLARLFRLHRAPQAPLVSARVLATVVVTGLAAGGAAVLVHPEQWMIERVVFEGQRRASVAELRHLADLPNGTTVWQVDVEAIERGVARHPWVRSVDATFVWPDTVRVTVDEHTPVALLHDHAGGTEPGQLWCVDEEGVAFLPATAADLDLPHLTGFGRDLAGLHPDLPRLAVANALALITALDDRGLVSRDVVSEVAFDPGTGFVVVAGPARIAFGLGALSIDDQVDRLAVLVAQGVSLDTPTYVDLAPVRVALVHPFPWPPAPAGG